MSQQEAPGQAARSGPIEPLGRVTSIKVKLGLLVAASVLVASVLATLGAGAVPAALSIPVTVLLALGVTQLLAVGMTSPLRQMTEAARRMAAGDYDVRVETSSTDDAMPARCGGAPPMIAAEAAVMTAPSPRPVRTTAGTTQAAVRPAASGPTPGVSSRVSATPRAPTSRPPPMRWRAGTR